MSDSLWPHGLEPTSLLCPWNFPGKNIGVGCHSLLQRIFPTQRLNLGLLHCRFFTVWATREALTASAETVLILPFLSLRYFISFYALSYYVGSPLKVELKWLEKKERRHTSFHHLVSHWILFFFSVSSSFFFFVDTLWLRKFSSSPKLLKVLLSMLNYVICFLCINQEECKSLYYFIHVTNYINYFLIVKPTLYTWGKSPLIRCIISSLCAWQNSSVKLKLYYSNFL